jgi:hypothetical protein
VALAKGEGQMAAIRKLIRTDCQERRTPQRAAAQKINETKLQDMNWLTLFTNVNLKKMNAFRALY